jgi:GNAT superfamily N-acetyltransferase
LPKRFYGYVTWQQIISRDIRHAGASGGADTRECIMSKPIPDKVKPFLKPLSQPNGYTCGPTCVKIFCDAIGAHTGLSVMDIAKRSGTNPRTGTTDVTMEKGLRSLKLAWARPRETTTDYLRHSIANGNVIFLRTLMHGFKHWILLDGYSDGKFDVMCPSRGRDRFTDSYVHSIWSARDFDFFEAPKDPAAHPILNPKAIFVPPKARQQKPERPEIHEMTLLEFVKRLPVVAPRDFTGFHRRAIADVAMFARRNAENARGKVVSHVFEDFTFRVMKPHRAGPDGMVVTDPSGQAVAGILMGTRWVDERYRGRGLGAELIIAAHKAKDAFLLFPTSYSEAGFGSRLAAHRISLERALEAGNPVSDRVMADYDRAADGSLMLRAGIADTLRMNGPDRRPPPPIVRDKASEAITTIRPLVSHEPPPEDDNSGSQLSLF